MKNRLIMCVTFATILCATVLLNRSTIAQDAPSTNAPRTVEITASRFAFVPSEITLKVGQPVVLKLKSTDVAHGLSFSEFNQDIKISKGGTAEMSLTPDKAGDFIGQCSSFCGSGHGGMKLTLHVVE
jgi:cytochrome c oxidase subunit 2